MSAAKWRPCSPGLNVLIYMIILKRTRMLSVQFVALHKPRKPKLNTLRPKQNGRHFADDIFKCIFLNENVWIPIKISVKFVPKGTINNIPALVQMMAWRRPGDKPLSESMMVSLPTHICVTRPQWVKLQWTHSLKMANCTEIATDIMYHSRNHHLWLRSSEDHHEQPGMERTLLAKHWVWDKLCLLAIQIIFSKSTLLMDFDSNSTETGRQGSKL